MTLNAAIKTLAAQQSVNGSFEAWSGPLTSPFAATKQQSTAFQTMLIADALSTVSGAQQICVKAAKYIAAQMNERGAWNYWTLGSTSAHNEPYPDDLDDTACALAALYNVDVEYVGAQQVGRFARLLVSAEQSTGGPYNTWLIHDAKWQQVDLAVNANIGYALSQHGVTPAGLRTYLETSIKNDEYSSAYYVGELPVVYFISRWYAGDAQPQLQAKITNLLANSDELTPLSAALLLSAARLQNISNKHADTLQNKLKQALIANDLVAEPFYVDPAYNQQQYYGGSAMLTTAFVLQALSLLPPELITSTQPKRKQINMQELPNADLQQAYDKVVSRVLSSADGNQVSGAASLAEQAIGAKIPPKVTSQLNEASLDGWVAYTLYDDVLDGGQAKSISLANIAMRRSYHGFMNAVKQQDHKRYVCHVFDTIDAANDWELHYTRPQIKNDVLTITQLPDYRNLSQLAERSLGHSLAACGVAALHYGSLEHEAVKALQTFFNHFLIARQLNDDAHDWEDDLRAGQLSAVVTYLLQDYDFTSGDMVIAEHIAALQQCFWTTTIDSVAKLIEDHVSKARSALEQMTLSDEAVFGRWLDALQSSAEAAITARNQAQLFMNGYKVETVDAR